MKRQAMKITLSQLTDLKMDLIKQQQEMNKKLNLKDPHYVNYDQKFQINIINKTPECSDTWELEEDNSQQPEEQTDCRGDVKTIIGRTKIDNGIPADNFGGTFFLTRTKIQ